jgi:prepilin-type N-terminal cleavage/methylation domain-containing protein
MQLLSPQRKSSSTIDFNKGFTLVELSIVLMVIGLLVSGILVGQDMIRAAELRSIATQKDQTQTAVNLFRDKYLNLPGDLPNAVKFWGVQAGGTSDEIDTICQNLDRNTPSTTTSTCNGNGDGKIGTNWNNNLAFASNFEVFRFWQHLSNAGLIAGTFSGVTDSTINDYTDGPVTTAGLNVLEGKISTSGFLYSSWGNVTNGAMNAFNVYYGDVMIFGKTNCNGGAVYHCYPSAILTPAETYIIDKKTDDGLPGNGNIVVFGIAQNPNCASSMDPETSIYLVNETNKNCGLIFKMK